MLSSYSLNLEEPSPGDVSTKKASSIADPAEIEAKLETPSYLTDGSRVSCAVQSTFLTIDADDTSKFSGDLTHSPAFDIWEQHYVGLMKDSFPKLEQAKCVLYLADALTGDAQRYYYEQLVPRLGRALPGLESARPPPVEGLGENIRILSEAILALENRFCTPDARNVLHQTMNAMTLSSVCQELKCSKSDGLRELKRRIDKLSANGPREYKNETCKIDTFTKCLARETWALMPIMRCKDPNATQTLQYYVDGLVSHLHTSASIYGVQSLAGVLYTDAADDPDDEFGKYFARQDADIFYGERQVQSRFKQRQGQSRQGHGGHGALRRSPSKGSGPPRGNSSFRQSLASGNDLRDMLTDDAKKDVCWRCRKPGHRWRDCNKPKQTILEASRIYLSSYPDEANKLISILAANCDDSYIPDESDQLDARDADSGNDSVLGDQNDAINEVFAAFSTKRSEGFC